MDNYVDNFRIEEYKSLRNEIAELQRAINQLFGIAIAASVAILSAVATVFFKLEQKELEKLNYAYAYPFLAPIAVILPIMFVLISHRRDIHRCGTYIFVFIEETLQGPLWESRLAKFRSTEHGESFDYLPITFWAITLISVGSFVYALYIISGFSICRIWVIAVCLILLIIIMMIAGHVKFHYASRDAIGEFKKIWGEIKSMENKTNDRNAT